MAGRTDRLDSILMKEISSIIQFDLNNPDYGLFRQGLAAAAHVPGCRLISLLS